MILKALSFGGSLDISAPETLGDPWVTPFRRTMRSGDVITVPDEYLRFPNIINAVNLGLLQVVSYDSEPQSLVINAELDQALAGFSGGSGGSSYSGFSGYSGGGGTVGSGAIEILDHGTPIGVATALDFEGANILAQSEASGLYKIFVPPPQYVSHFNTADGLTNATVSGIGTAGRYVSAPASEGNPFQLGGWTAGTVQSVFRAGTIQYATAGLFSVMNNTSTVVTVYVKDAYGTVIASHAEMITGNLDITQNGIEIRVSSFAADSAQYKAQLNVTITMASVLPNGGRASYSIVHQDGTDGTFTFSQNDIFYDPDNVPATVGGVTVTQGTPATKYLSGVDYYKEGSTFDVGVTAIDNLNNLSYPGTQLVVQAPAYGLPTLSLGGGSLAGWTDAYNNTGDSYMNSAWAITSLNYFVMSSTATASATPQDWSAGTAAVSADASVIIDTYQADATDIYEDFTDESRRLESDLATSWDSTQSLASYDSGSGLQVIMSRLEYPTKDFIGYSPNPGSQPNYSGLSGTRVYQRIFKQTNVNHSNGTMQFSDYNVTEANLSSDDVRFEISLDGTNWFNCNLNYPGGAISNGSGCRINSDTVALDINSSIQFTFGTGLFTDVTTPGPWGMYLRITFKATTAGMAAYVGAMEISDWV